ncbi:Calcium/calmodulin dependent protein kinase II association domain-containing protein [Bhargavaea ginsengi]|uniref:Calcium/calmodulin dependent protein kinase II association domain-containing protein n=1 Tax=Bhargavaea ginsengi TaxID=426757 RepID=A0A1H7AJZ3_9BACL|nr:nuclear transport factor 2 family protein [Bhargavaea ginsengi]SEJ62220.1 Calcium/calmodulin dependent protein kinase II association domain-containing protein [Bhargavaea ginsengi]
MTNLKWLLAPAAAVLILTGCGGDEGENTNSADEGNAPSGQQSAIGHGTEDGAIGFEMANDGSIEEASGVPKDEKAAILESFDRYIETFNTGDIDGYLAILATGEGAYDPEQERVALEQMSGQFDKVERNPSDMTVVSFEGNEAQLFANMETTIVGKENSDEVTEKGRQVTVFTKQDGEWKVKEVYYVGNMPGA